MSIAKKAISGTIWMSGISYIGFAINFGVQLVLVRLLVPEDFGIFVLGLSIAEILFIFFSFSFSMAVIQIHEAEDLFDTAFYLSLLSGFVILIIGGIISLLLSPYYPLQSIIAFFILCAIQPIQGCSYIYSASMEKELQFKKNAFVRGIATNFSGFGAVFLAYMGFGVWSLVGKEIFSVILMFFGMRAVSNYRFGKKFNKNTARRIFDFAYQRMLVRGLEISFFRIPLFLLGTFAGPRILGLFSQVYYLANLPNTMLGPANQTVAFATYSKVQDEKDKLSKGFYISNFFFVRIVLPVALLVYLFSSNILGILYGTKWLEASEIFKYLSIYMLILPVFINAVILTLSIGKLISTIKIYVFCGISLFPGIIITLYSENFWLLSLSYSLALLIGLIVAIYLLEKEGISISVRKLFLVPSIILVGIILLGEYIDKKLFPFAELPLFIILTLAILFCFISLFSEYKESVKNFHYIKSRMIIQK
jgi:PST family polysaccharide transporter